MVKVRVERGYSHEQASPTLRSAVVIWRVRISLVTDPILGGKSYLGCQQIACECVCVCVMKV